MIRKRVVLNSVLGVTLVGTGFSGWLVVRDKSPSAGATRTVVTAARGTEAYLLLWLRLWGALKTGDINIKVVR